MAYSIVNTSNFTVEKDGQTVGQASVSADPVVVFAADDFTMTKTPASTVWTDTTSPMSYTIVFTNASGVAVDEIAVTDTMPVASATAAGLTLDTASVQATITPSAGVVIDTSASTTTNLVVTATGTVDAAAVLTVTFNANYAAPTP